MENIIVVLDDAEYALQMLAPMKDEGHPTQWILLACPPRLTRHIGRWVSPASREAWRNKWSMELVQKLKPVLTAGSDRLQWRLAKGALEDQTRRLQAEFTTHRVFDARRPRLGQDHEPVAAGQPVERNSQWSLSGGVATMGVVLLMAAD